MMLQESRIIFTVNKVEIDFGFYKKKKDF